MTAYLSPFPRYGHL